MTNSHQCNYITFMDHKKLYDHGEDYNAHTHSGSCGCASGHVHENASHPRPAHNKAHSLHRHHKTLLWTSVVAALSHIFCCVLPGIFGLLALLSGLGIVVTLPGWVDSFHEQMHGIEVPVLIFSGIIVALGWLAHFYSKEHDCHEVGECHHHSCQPRKKKVSIILILASLLFCINLVVYFMFHATSNLTANTEIAAQVHNHDH